MISGRGLLDTSVLIGSENGRAVDTRALPEEVHICVVTLAELQAGVLAAADTAIRARRLATLESLAELEPLPIDTHAAAHWAAMRVRVAEERRKMNVNDLWIAAVALANDLAVVTQDSDFDVLEWIGGPAVVRV
jgi:predicted nucleic acid-binding protein